MGKVPICTRDLGPRLPRDVISGKDRRRNDGEGNEKHWRSQHDSDAVTDGEGGRVVAGGKAMTVYCRWKWVP